MTSLLPSRWISVAGLLLEHKTITDVLFEAAADVPDTVALIDVEAGPGSSRRWTYQELERDAREAAAALLQDFRPGDRVGVWAPNRAEWLILQYGAALAGLTLVTVNPAYKYDELLYAVRQSRMAGLFHNGQYRGYSMIQGTERLRGDVPAIRLTHDLNHWEEYVARGRGETVALPPVNPGAACQIQFTSGTTGRPKAAVLHHVGMVNAARMVADRSRMVEGEVWVNCMPLFHIGGNGIYPFAVYNRRGTYVLLPEFDVARFADAVATFHGRICVLVPTMLHRLLAAGDDVSRKLSCLRLVLSGGTNVPESLIQRATEAFGCTLGVHYGQTELHGIIAQTDLDAPRDQVLTTVGRALPGVEVQIVCPGTSTLVAPGEVGEICARGYQVMIEYFDQPDATAATIDDEGWLHTGDLGTMDDDGLISITGRLKDMIIRGGENIYPREIEEVLTRHPAVESVCVVGLPDEEWGEIVAAVITPAPGASTELAEELREMCRRELARPKVPHKWFLTEEMPTTASGKIQKFAVQKSAANAELQTLATRSNTKG
ncbi:AMP-binding protein [Kocuria himachalensis]